MGWLTLNRQDQEPKHGVKPLSPSHIKKLHVVVCVSDHFNDSSGREKCIEIKISYFANMKGRHETF